MKTILFQLIFTALLVSSCSKESTKESDHSHLKKIDRLSKELAILKSKEEKNPSILEFIEPVHHSDHNCPSEKAILTLTDKMEKKLISMRQSNSLFNQNKRLMDVADAMEGHTKLYEFFGDYKVLLIPVQFNDVKFEDPDFFTGADGKKAEAYDYLFGQKDSKSLRQYYKHTSMGKLNVDGVISPVVTVDKDLFYYGQAMPSKKSDRAARELVVDALLKLKETQTDHSWWDQFDNWDLNDYDSDKNFHEPDGFIDAVVLVYAGKSQASCQKTFDPNNTRPASNDIPSGPRQSSAIECFNRIWPHRWAVSLASNNPHYSPYGPKIEGSQRPAMGGLKIHDGLFALDYNMQSEYSDRSTFIHEFGHSLSLPDIYSYGPRPNNTGFWEIMSANANLRPQEMSTWSKLSLGWISPKIIKQGENTSLYLGAYNYVSHNQRDGKGFNGPNLNSYGESIVSTTPGFDEDVYRSAIILTEPTKELIPITTLKPEMGSKTAYSGRFDGETRQMTINLKVPKVGDATLSFDTFYHLETETNFNTKDPNVKVKAYYDVGHVKIDNVVKEKLRLISGDDNQDSLNENNPACDVDKALAYRSKFIKRTLTQPEYVGFFALLQVCQKPIWVKKQYNLEDKRGQDIQLTIEVITDAGYNETGVLVDNIRLGNQLITFENAQTNYQDFKIIQNGNDSKFNNQFYLMEYRLPGEDFLGPEGSFASYNMDNNIASATQAMFLDNNEGESLTDRFRMITAKYQPGVLVWYYNSNFSRRDNSPATNEGKGYLLVVNPKIREFHLPGILGDEKLLTKEGHYDINNDYYKAFNEQQKRLFQCFGFTTYTEWQSGKPPECSDVSDSIDVMEDITFNDEYLIYRRKRFNELLPKNRYGRYPIGAPLRHSVLFRTGLSTFRPKGESFRPFKVYQVNEDKALILDEQLTEKSKTYKAVSSFSDAKNVFSSYRRFQEDTAVVEKKGLNFRITRPSQRIKDLYKIETDGDDNHNFNRRPRAKILINWDQ